MSAEKFRLARPFGWVDGTLLVVSVVCFGIGLATPIDVGLVLGAYAFLLGTSTLVVTEGLERFTGDAISGGGDIDEDTGWLIGKLENVLVLTFTLTGAYTALSIVFAAKSIIRREDMSSGNTTYYLAGTLLNFTYSMAIGLVFERFVLEFAGDVLVLGLV